MVRLRQDDEAALEPPPQQHLRGGALDALGDLSHHRIGEIAAVRERAVGLDRDTVRRAVRDELAPECEWAELYLVDGRPHGRDREERVEIGHEVEIDVIEAEPLEACLRLRLGVIRPG
jgi:hypothetical protein